MPQTDTPIPASAEEITSEWLGEALGTPARSVQLVDAHSGTTGRARLRVAWEGEPALPGAIFAKLAPTDPLQKQMVLATGMGKREARVFDALAAELPVRVPAPLWAGWNEAGDAYLMLMEDLAEAGCSFPSSADDPGRHPEGMMDALAQLHGSFWESERLEPGGDLDWIERPMRGEIGPLLVKSALEQFAADMPPEFRALGELYVGNMEGLNDLLDDGPRTLLHGDSHMGNTFVDGERVGLLDWACTASAPGIRDVSYYLCSSLPTERRRRDERALLGRYLRGLAAAGGPALAEETVFEQHRRYAVCAWIAATVTAAAGERMQSLAVGMRAMRRATDAIIDLGTPELLSGALRPG